jgi:hypothetical protein
MAGGVTFFISIPAYISILLVFFLSFFQYAFIITSTQVGERTKDMASQLCRTTFYCYYIYVFYASLLSPEYYWNGM